MPRPKKTTVQDIKRVAVLVSQGYSQVEIARLLEVSPSTVHRLVVQSEDRQWLVRKYNCTLSDAEILEAAGFLLGAELEAKLRVVNKNLQVCRVFPAGGVEMDYSNRLQRFAAQAASCVAKELTSPKVRLIGVSWGITLRTVIEALRRCLAPVPPRDSPVDCVPISGSPPDAEVDTTRSSSHLAGKLSKLLTGSEQNPHAFSASAWIPGHFSESETRVIQAFFHSHSKYASTFQQGGLVERLECILTSAASSTEFAGPWLTSAARAGNIRPTELQTITAGNISGWFLPKPGLQCHQLQKVERVNARWTGIRLEHLRACADVAARKKLPGVVLLAVGRSKAQVILEALRHGLINSLLVDHELGDGLTSLLELSPAQS